MNDTRLLDTIIFGKRSNLSVKLHQKIEASLLVSSQEYFDRTFDFTKLQITKPLTLIINSFYPSISLNDYTHPKTYAEESVYLLASILEDLKNIDPSKINKIIYTSSASVYGNNTKCSENDPLTPINLYGSLKLASEKLVETFCNTMKIDYTITRIFNMYGGDDRFSIIEKIIQSALNKETITLANEGKAIRDFIHIDDVISVYLFLINEKNLNHINIGSGVGISIASIVETIERHGLVLHKEHTIRTEIDTSIASVERLSHYLDMTHRISVYDYIADRLSGCQE